MNKTEGGRPEGKVDKMLGGKLRVKLNKWFWVLIGAFVIFVVLKYLRPLFNQYIY